MLARGRSLCRCPVPASPACGAPAAPSTPARRSMPLPPTRIDEGHGSGNDTLDDRKEGANVRSYFVWSFLDVFEFLSGYQSRYGLYRVGFDDEAPPPQARLSAHWPIPAF
ncbi:hypothetical protein BRADI_3g29512v3 [Brachypodium distachyon]|uniref:4-hydroxy-7-methoxy-3-oxo-3,4-dihydro-2H-1,4-benzoxazin-2-yl glucosidebeta-D-glucosidase n=1 Tax=Brachypodium distachyon TaxID=15368 RepID=A0A0Q3LY78_BRADI|nr:hypothetical protein BRADI_3g29512v3 [Brachypodium distachyon]